ncbi:tRNA (adenosine(37)-N6)-threonylcarbamoyltransferase complex dimerization subunit type 1 TsaB [Microcoleus sp. FACHB-SPT15]|uniref:tRNA (adenosine(37)-N6)-threonylcarbamoyltransferase complex dimerization subunit type 1 TsaB n=1 Tax=Microcoleus sp. FACHB-SPT15 TaxID=2692830 RepID=UPI00178628DB|nr:tRNA (adenosine(37)-N6)-threonylcarbamoyltransferase complex dimerization subunit type 1 TsaB [Microcoleus sp. FACHB-SPT15]MBD1809826.1 tRNA (adenosine(37)-N6)-threonylcarbamoyltransferase complex dimerization subunit type 1 TsaB [Microcoleus sp. FACHB-SPT15]
MQHFDPNKYALALHTTSSQLGLAVSNFAGDTRSSTWDLGRDLSSHLHQHLVEFLTPQRWADLAFIAVAKGPGSFTSTRIGIVTARTLAQQLNVPLFAISTLAAVAWLQRLERAESLDQNAIALQMNAHRGELFVAIYQANPTGVGLTPLLLDTVMTQENWKQVLESSEIPCQLIDVPSELGTSVTSVLSLAYLDWQQGKRPHWSEALPFYGQHPVDDKAVK